MVISLNVVSSRLSVCKDCLWRGTPIHRSRPQASGATVAAAGREILTEFLGSCEIVPQDAASQTGMAVPMYLMYEGGILLAPHGAQLAQRT
jgi:hypothetical protein